MDRTSSQIAPRTFKDNGHAAPAAAAESSRLRAGRLESFAALAGGATHEMSNLLATVLMSVEILRGDCQSPAVRDVLAALEQTTRRGLGITRQLQWLACGVNGAPTLFQPRFLIADLRALVASTFGRSIVVTSSYSPDLWLLEGDPLLLYQSLLDLVLAARDALDGGSGTIEIAARNERLDLEPGEEGGEGSEVPHVVFEVTARRPLVAGGTRTGGGTQGGTRPDFAACGFARRLCRPAAGMEAYDGLEGAGGEPRRGAGQLVLIADEEAALGDMLAAVLEQFGYRALTVRQAASFDERLAEVAVVLTTPEAAGRALALVAGHRDPAAAPRVLLMGAETGAAGGGPGAFGAPGDAGDPGEQRASLPKPFTTAQLLASLARVLEVEPPIR